MRERGKRKRKKTKKINWSWCYTYERSGEVENDLSGDEGIIRRMMNGWLIIKWSKWTKHSQMKRKFIKPMKQGHHIQSLLLVSGFKRGKIKQWYHNDTDKDPFFSFFLSIFLLLLSNIVSFTTHSIKHTHPNCRKFGHSRFRVDLDCENDQFDGSYFQVKIFINSTQEFPQNPQSTPCTFNFTCWLVMFALGYLFSVFKNNPIQM